ncbi:MAG: phage capsid protein [Proteobacteria bacterium]|nr:phage capsid protein [Pseudomonadota bacterium]
MLKGLALTPPVVGRIAIGKVVVKDGKRLPEKDDEFTITTQVQGRNGWVLHPLDGQLRKAGGAGSKLRAIPVRLLFDDPDLNLRANYSVFDRATGRPLCVGNGETCRRSTRSGVQSLPCPSPEGCELGAKTGCKPYARLNVRIVDKDAKDDAKRDASGDELGSFIFRTTGFNSIRSLAARLRYFQALSGNHLSALPLELRLRGKSTTQSHRAPIYYVDLTARTGSTLAQALEGARQEVQARQASGFDQAALDQAAQEGFAAGAFEESVEEGAAVVEEFFPEDADETGASAHRGAGTVTPPNHGRPALGDKLQRLVSNDGRAPVRTGEGTPHASSG